MYHNDIKLVFDIIMIQLGWLLLYSVPLSLIAALAICMFHIKKMNKAISSNNIELPHIVPIKIIWKYIFHSRYIFYMFDIVTMCAVIWWLYHTFSHYDFSYDFIDIHGLFGFVSWTLLMSALWCVPVFVHAQGNYYIIRIKRK